MTIRSLLHVVKHLNLNTFYFNFKSFPFYTAIRFPVFLTRNVILKNISGKTELPSPFHTGSIRIGFGEVGIFDKKRSKTIWDVKGSVVFMGPANIGHGAKICVGQNGTLSFGAHFNLTAESSIICFYKISFGAYCLLSWEILMMDTDFHKVYKMNMHINEDRAIEIGDKVWIGARCTILKGVLIPAGSVIATGSVVTRSFTQPNSVFAGFPAKIINENIEWKL